MINELLKRYDLSGKTAIVTGGSSGMGYAIALDLAKHGANIVIADVVSNGQIIEEVKKIGRQILYVETNVRSPKEIDEVTKRTMNEFERIDILINCAGILSRSKIIEMAEQDWDQIMDINLKGVFLCSRSVAPHMIKQKAGKIVNMGSASSRGPMLNMPQGGADYCISKSGVHALTRQLAWELAPYGINVNTVAPGPVETPMHKGHIEVVREKYGDRIPLGKLGKPEDIAYVVTFLVTDAASYITGQAIHVNGGLLMVD